MTHDTREVEEVVKEFEETWSDFVGDIEYSDAFKHLADDPDVPFVLPEMCKWLCTTLTHQLQKAREEEVRLFMTTLKERANTVPPNLLLNEIVNYAHDRLKVFNHSELDQDKI